MVIIRTIALLVLIGVTWLLPCSYAAQYREMIPNDRTYFVRTDGNNVNNGFTDSPQGAFQTFQRAADVVAVLDFGGKMVTIQHGTEGGVKTFNESISVPALTGGGGLKFSGSSTPGNTIIAGTGGECFRLNSTHAEVTFSNITLTNNGSVLIIVVGNSTLSFGNGVRLGPASFAHIYIHDNQALGYLLSINYTIFGSAPCHIFVNGGMLFLEYSHEEIVGTPSFWLFLGVINGGRIQCIANTFSGSIAGPPFGVWANGVINTFGGGIGILPGAGTGYISSGGQFQ